MNELIQLWTLQRQMIEAAYAPYFALCDTLWKNAIDQAFKPMNS